MLMGRSIRWILAEGFGTNYSFYVEPAAWRGFMQK